MKTNKRPLSSIQSDLERAEEETRTARERVQRLQAEQSQNEDFQRREAFRGLLNDAKLFVELFEGDEPLLKLDTVSLDKTQKVVAALKKWKDEAVKTALAAQSRATRVAIETKEYIDYDPYDDRPYKQYMTTYSDGSSDVRYGGKV